MVVSAGLRNYLRQRAGWVWREQARAFSHGLSLQEETLTEMLLLRMAQDHAAHGLSVTMFNKHVEGINGADWEWIIRTPACEISLRVQAKRLFHANTGKEYGGLDPKSSQVDKLIKQAGSCIPVYVFYNHEYGINSALLDQGAEPPYRGRSFWGCAIAGAHAVKKANSNSLKDIKKIMKPWHHLVSAQGACGVTAALGISAGVALDKMPPSRRQMIERIRDPDFMLTYLSVNDLAGAAVIDVSDFRG